METFPKVEKSGENTLETYWKHFENIFHCFYPLITTFVYPRWPNQNMVAFNPGSFQHGYPIFYRKQGYFVVLNFRKFVVKRDKNGQKCTKSSKKHPFFHTFIKVWIWPRPLPPLQCGKNPHFLFIFFFEHFRYWFQLWNHQQKSQISHFFSWVHLSE